MNYDPVAGIYDGFAQLVFWGSIKTAQIVHLEKIRKHSKILIIGGGTGWILDYLPAHSTSVTYVEPSREMMNKSQKRNLEFHADYIESPLENVTLSSDYDVIITNFFFDQFDETKGKILSKNLFDKMNDDGIWLVTDFMNRGAWWQRGLLKIMYSFFRTTTGLETSQLPDWGKNMEVLGLHPLITRTFYGDFIVSVCYKKTPLPV